MDYSILTIGTALNVVNNNDRLSDRGVKPNPTQTAEVAAEDIVFHDPLDAPPLQIYRLPNAKENLPPPTKLTSFEVFVALQPNYESLDLSNRDQVKALVESWNELPESRRRWFNEERVRLSAIPRPGSVDKKKAGKRQGRSKPTVWAEMRQPGQNSWIKIDPSVPH